MALHYTNSLSVPSHRSNLGQPKAISRGLQLARHRDCSSILTSAAYNLRPSSGYRSSIISASGKDISATPWSGPPERRPNSKSSTPAITHSSSSDGHGPSLDLSTGMATLIALNVAIFAGAAFAKLPPLAGLALYNASGSWWQYATSAFVHANVAHLSRNMFLLWLWGSALRRVVGGPGVWFSYILCALASNMAAAYTLGAKAQTGTALLGVAASGGCAGVALAALILTAQPSLRWLLGAALAVQFTLPALIAMPVPFTPAAAGGAAAAGQFALARLLPPYLLVAAGDEYSISTAVSAAGGTSWGGFLTALKSPAMSWLWGAAAGALIVVLLAKLPVPPE